VCILGAVRASRRRSGSSYRPDSRRARPLTLRWTRSPEVGCRPSQGADRSYRREPPSHRGSPPGSVGAGPEDIDLRPLLPAVFQKAWPFSKLECPLTLCASSLSAEICVPSAEVTTPTLPLPTLAASNLVGGNRYGLMRDSPGGGSGSGVLSGHKATRNASEIYDSCRSGISRLHYSRCLDGLPYRAAPPALWAFSQKRTRE